MPELGLLMNVVFLERCNYQVAEQVRICHGTFEVVGSYMVNTEILLKQEVSLS